MRSSSEGDDNERFLADLRGLRDTAALEFDELAARAHYPSDVLKEAEGGPSLPSLPILAAYVRACDGDVPEWEERWRRLGLESRADPSLPVRRAGASPAAVAGARAGVSVAPPDAYDPERIRAALRGSHGRSDRGARGAAWDGAAAHLTSTSTNGNHHVSQPGGGSSDAAVEPPDAARADAIRRDPFSPDWLADRELTSPPATESGRPDRAEDEPSAAAPDSWFTPRETPDHERTWDAEPSPEAADAWFTPHERADSGLPSSPSAEPPQEHAASAPTELVTGFWTPSAAAAPTEVQRPGPPPTEGNAIPRASWSAPAETPASGAPTAADRTTPIPAQVAAAAAAAAPRAMSGPAVPPGPAVPRGPAVPPSQSRPDRLYPVRLLVVIVVAALIGSILVLLLR